ncbi:ADOP family duplicated permease [Aliikangiella coralliicola]|uniref:FtsX-like permease family protein n=1 Tax=Aliikangiella coralliicola TaxID=2592383 RepID=A0A545UF84_9GAMM|nr:ADOP family duplicated permease [Aliikangiella coralliicola]TQV88137.1 FtsX-like permease family protein [Aliikangiella coralliicola]
MMTIQDLKYALRLLSKRPGFTALTTLVMAVGIGLSVYLFSFLNTMAYKPLPFEDSESLVVIDQVRNGLLLNGGNLDPHDYYEIKNNVKSFSEIAAYAETSINVSGHDGARRYNATKIEPNVFHMTRTKPILGREFTQAENHTGAENVVIIGYDIWKNMYGGDPEVLDQIVRVNGKSARIIGVMPEGYFFPRNSELWVPLQEDPTKVARGDGESCSVLAHLGDGIDLDQVNREIDVVMKRIEEKFPKTNNGIGAFATTFPMSTMGNGGSVFLFSMYVVTILLLLLASINVSNLLLSRAVERNKETAIRVALGAPRARLIGQMLWESTIICTVGGVIGLLVAAWGLEVTESITNTFTGDKPFFWWKFGVDSFTLKIFFAFVVSTILMTGVFPAWKNTGTDFNAVLRDGTRGAAGKKAGRLNRLLVISEVFLTMTVLIAASVMVVGTYIAANADYGAKVDNILAAEIRLPQATYNTHEKRVQFVKSLQSRLENNVGVGNVAITSSLPGDYTWSPTVAIEGKEYADESSYPRANYIAIMPGTLAKLGVELRSGRYFENLDEGSEKRTVIVTESFVKKHFGEESPLGKRVRIAEIDGDKPRWLTIVGVVEHTIQGQSFSPNAGTPSIFRPLMQSSRRGLTVAMEMKAAPAVTTGTLRNTLESIDPDVPAFLIKTYQEIIDRNTAGIGFASKIFLIFAIVAVVLASSGIYGVMSNTVVQRTQEIGVKRALGADEKRVIMDFLNSGIKQLLWGGIPGLLAGGSLGFALSRLLATGNSSVVAIAAVMIAIIGSVVIISTYLPTRRTLALEPSDALRYE